MKVSLRVGVTVLTLALLCTTPTIAARLAGTVEPPIGAPLQLASCELWTDGTLFFWQGQGSETSNPDSHFLVRATFYDRSGKVLFTQLMDIQESQQIVISSLIGRYADNREKIVKMSCAVDSRGLSDMGYGDLVPYKGAGADRCSNPLTMVVDGGPMATFDGIAYGSDWVSLRLIGSINNFIPTGYDTFDRTPFFMNVDDGKPTVVKVTGRDPQEVAITANGLRPGHHRIVYGVEPLSEDLAWTFCFHN